MYRNLSEFSRVFSWCYSLQYVSTTRHDISPWYLRTVSLFAISSVDCFVDPKIMTDPLWRHHFRPYKKLRYLTCFTSAPIFRSNHASFRLKSSKTSTICVISSFAWPIAPIFMRMGSISMSRARNSIYNEVSGNFRENSGDLVGLVMKNELTFFLKVAEKSSAKKCQKIQILKM